MPLELIPIPKAKLSEAGIPSPIGGMTGLLSGEPVIVLFSTGKDSIVMTDLLVKHYTGRIVPVFMYFVAGLSIKQRVIDYYQKRWNLEIEQVPHFTTLCLKTGKKYHLADIERGLRATYNISWIAEGYKKTDSLARRGMLANLPHGIDERNRKIYPVSDWNDKKIMAYIKVNRLQLPIEYNHGLKHDFSVPDAKLLLYLKNNFPGDYRKVITEFPNMEALVWAEQN
jgi:sulfate adenylyltransferase subunit 2